MLTGLLAVLGAYGSCLSKPQSLRLIEAGLTKNMGVSLMEDCLKGNSHFGTHFLKMSVDLDTSRKTGEKSSQGIDKPDSDVPRSNVELRLSLVFNAG